MKHKCNRFRNIPAFTGGGTFEQCVDCLLYKSCCKGDHEISQGFCLKCGQFSPMLAGFFNANTGTSTDQIIITDSVWLSNSNRPTA